MTQFAPYAGTPAKQYACTQAKQYYIFAYLLIKSSRNSLKNTFFGN